jgi:hypothetical protein
MSRNVTAVVLCEDKQSRTVLYRYLKHERGFERVRVLPLPAGQGCGSQHVRENYAREVRRQRDRSVAAVLIVHIDADHHTVPDCHRELANELMKSGMDPREHREPIALVVPRWEMETWLHHYMGRPGVVETEQYSNSRGERRRLQRRPWPRWSRWWTGRRHRLPTSQRSVSRWRSFDGFHETSCHRGAQHDEQAMTSSPEGLQKQRGHDVAVSRQGHD